VLVLGAGGGIGLAAIDVVVDPTGERRAEPAL
jgi:hypothetical protein